MIANIVMWTFTPKREAVTGDWRNSRQESFHFVFVHRMLSRMTKSRRELAWNIARMGEVGNTHRMLWSMKRIFSYNLDESRSSKLTCTLSSLLEMAPLERYMPSVSSPYTRSTRSDSILHWVSKKYEAPVTQLRLLCMSVRSPSPSALQPWVGSGLLLRFRNNIFFTEWGC
jgi:hypothetical protein